MYRTEDRRKAVELRLQGMTYSQIGKIIKAGKGTLHYWLRDHPLSEEQLAMVKAKKELQIEHFIEAMKKRREDLLVKVYEEQKKTVGTISKRDIFVAGAFLYWGEGQKGSSSVSVSNSDPRVLKFCMAWFEICFGISRVNPKLKIYLHLYSDMDFEKEKEFWKNTLGTNYEQFAKPYIKNSTRNSLDYKSFGHGTCRIQISNAKIKNEIMATIKIFSEYSDFFLGT